MHKLWAYRRDRPALHRDGQTARPVSGACLRLRRHRGGQAGLLAQLLATLAVAAVLLAMLGLGLVGLAALLAAALPFRTVLQLRVL